jgi:hypothetical protein
MSSFFLSLVLGLLEKLLGEMSLRIPNVFTEWQRALAVRGANQSSVTPNLRV